MGFLNYYYIPSEMDGDICNKIVEKYYDPSILKPSFVTKKNVLKAEIRKSSQTWLPKDCWVAGMLKHFIESANINYYNFDLTGWNDSIQFTVYDPPDNRYNWHIDMMDSESNSENNMIRKLSIVMSLSSTKDYGGGEFQIIFPTKKVNTFKLDAGDVIIFPSTIPHRVKPVKWGRRISLVGWYGGPPFR
jgi:PKHD-type hydroxylase